MSPATARARRRSRPPSQFFAPEIEVLTFPAGTASPMIACRPMRPSWRAAWWRSPRLATTKSGDRPRIVLTTVNAVLQRVPARA